MEVNDLYSKNYKTHMKEIEKDTLTKMGKYPIFTARKNTTNLLILPNSETQCDFSHVPNTFPH